MYFLHKGLEFYHSALPEVGYQNLLHELEHTVSIEGIPLDDPDDLVFLVELHGIVDEHVGLSEHSPEDSLLLSHFERELELTVECALVPGVDNAVELLVGGGGFSLLGEGMGMWSNILQSEFPLGDGVLLVEDVEGVW